MIFDTPFVLAFLFILIPFAIFETLRYLASAAALKRLSLLKQEHRTRFILSAFLFALFIASIVTALAGPRWGTRSVMEYTRGVDVVFAFDVSRSMEAADIAPSRLGRAVEVARDAAGDMGGARIGAAFGKGTGVFALPLTRDRNAAATFFDSLLIAGSGGHGTNLESLVDAAYRAFLPAFPSKRIIVLFSDGETLSGSLHAAADRARADGISIAAVGLGTEEGGAVPQRFTLNEETGELLPDQLPITSVLRRDILTDAAERSGGVYIDGSAPDAALSLSRYIQSLAPETGVSSRTVEAAPRWYIFTLSALVFLLLSKMVEKKFRRREFLEEDA